MKAIETENLTKYYGKIRGILDVNLQVNEGDIFGFIGPNGSGKSTTIRTLLNFIFPSKGTAKIFGMDIIKDSPEIKKITGYLPSEINYYGDMSVFELLKYNATFYPQNKLKNIENLAERFQLNLNRKFDELSYGNKKKVGIIQALIHNPRLLILDEPTSGLDPIMQNVFYEVLQEENKNGKTIFFSSHILSEVQKLCNKVAIIKQGKILKVESMKDLRKNKFKTVTIEFEDENEHPFNNIKGIVKTERIGKVYKVLFTGDIKELLIYLTQQDLHNVLIEEPSLEEIFMHYYEREV